MTGQICDNLCLVFTKNYHLQSFLMYSFKTSLYYLLVKKIKEIKNLIQKPRLQS